MQTHFEHGLREYDLHLDPQRVHGPPNQRQVAMFVALLDVFGELSLVRDAPEDVLEREADGMIAESELAGPGPILSHRFGVVAQNRIFEMIENVRPGVEFNVMRVHVDDEIVIQVIAGDVAARVGQNFTRVGVRGDLLDRMLASDSRPAHCVGCAHDGILTGIARLSPAAA